MNEVVASIALGDAGPRVVDLHAALRAMLDRQIVEIPPTETGELEREFQQETASQSFGSRTLQLVVGFRVAAGLGDDPIVDSRTAQALNSYLADWGLLRPAGEARYVVRGRVVGSIQGHVVRAYDKDMRSEELLGETTPDDSGTFEIAYTADQFARAEKGSADLRLTVMNHEGREVVSAPIIFNAEQVELAPDLLIPDDGVSEYERLTEDSRLSRRESASKN